VKEIALLDNYDSFTYNLVHIIEKVSDCKVHVFLNDKVSLETLAQFDRIILSPGPGIPSEAGIMPRYIQNFHKEKNIFGICLGMQAIAEFFNSPLRNLNTVAHGIATPVTHHHNDYIFNSVPQNFLAGRYHSWVIDHNEISDELIVTARDSEKEIMAIKHCSLNIRGVQFHPESILSEHGELILKNWIENEPS
jgi:anthranilate synthase component II